MKRILCCILLVVLTGFVFGGDAASFVNLGFSPDSQYFMFAQYGFDDIRGTVYSDLFIVNVDKNSFVKEGVVSESKKVAVGSGFDPFGTVFSAYIKSASLVQKYKIDSSLIGRTLFTQHDSEKAKESLVFRDFKTNLLYSVELKKTALNQSTSFVLEVKVTGAENKSTVYTVGNADVLRKNVTDYYITKVIVAENGSMVFVIAKKIDTNGEIDIRYMVETFSPK